MTDNIRKRKPWVGAFIGLIFGPVIGFLYLNNAKIALHYFSFSLLTLALPFIVAQFWDLSLDPRTITNISTVIINIVGAGHCLWVARNSPPFPPKWYGRWYNIILIFMVLPLGCAVAFRNFCYEPFHVSSVSMEPTLNPEDYFFIEKRAYNSNRLPKRGDLIVFDVHEKNAKIQYVKRVVGLPGDRIQIDSQTKDAIILDQTILPSTQSLSMPVFTVPPEQYFVVGDNKNQSHDSRNGLGFISLKDIDGKALAIIWNEKTYKLSYKALEPISQ